MKTILIVEDEMDIAHLYRALFTLKGGYEVILALDDRQGFDLAKQHQPDLVISMWKTYRKESEFNGQEFLHQLRQDPITQSIPVLFYNVSLCRDEKLPQEMKTGNVSILFYPMNPTKILEKVSDLIGD